MVVWLRISLFCDMTPCHLVVRLSGSLVANIDFEDEHSTLSRNVGIRFPSDAASYPRTVIPNRGSAVPWGTARYRNNK